MPRASLGAENNIKILNASRVVVHSRTPCPPRQKITNRAHRTWHHQLPRASQMTIPHALHAEIINDQPIIEIPCAMIALETKIPMSLPDDSHVDLSGKPSQLTETIAETKIGLQCIGSTQRVRPHTRRDSVIRRKTRRALKIFTLKRKRMSSPQQIF